MSRAFKRISVLGAGSFGTAIANYMARDLKEHDLSVVLYGRDRETVESINSSHANPKRLPGIALDPLLTAQADLQAAIHQADLIVLGVPAQHIRQLTIEAKPFIPQSVPILSLAKGLEKRTHLRMSQVVREALGGKGLPFATLTGPSFAQDIALGSPIGITVGSSNKGLLDDLHLLLNSTTFDVKITTDIAGIEVGGALKNVFAIVAGILAGCGSGSSIMGDYFTRSMVEMRDVGMYCGGKWSTFSGRSGLGDLAVTCNDPSRNFRFGRTYAEVFDTAASQISTDSLAEQHKIAFEKTIEILGTRTVEGYDTIEPMYDIVKRSMMFAPIIQGAYELFLESRFRPVDLLPRMRTMDRRRKRDGTSVFSIMMHEFFPKLWYRRQRNGLK